MNDKCPYCHTDNEGYTQIFGAFYIDTKKKQLCTNYCKGQSIEYCPKCGRPFAVENGNHKIDEQKEFDFILNFINQNIASKVDFDNLLLIQQLRSIWSAYCLHQNYDVDTAKYDDRMLKIWSAIEENCGISYAFEEYERFYNVMSEYLV